jgi:hypothetical protein
LETVVPVVGVGGGGATTVALAMAVAAGGLVVGAGSGGPVVSGAPARVVECCPASVSGLAAASTAELGVAGAWRRGTRDGVLLERLVGEPDSASGVPVPSPPGTGGVPLLTVLDVGWRPGQVMSVGCWLSDVLAGVPAVVVVVPAAVRGFQRLEGVASVLGPERVVLGVVGPARRKRWPGPAARSAGYLAREVLAGGRVVEVREDAGLAVAGVDSSPLPKQLLSAAGKLLPAAGYVRPAGVGAGGGGQQR